MKQELARVSTAAMWFAGDARDHLHRALECDMPEDAERHVKEALRWLDQIIRCASDGLTTLPQAEATPSATND